MFSCEPFVTEFDDLTDAIMYQAANKTSHQYDGTDLKVVTWNIRFGIARFPFFGDSCGESVILDDAAIANNHW